jgi:hypothetical protein
VVVRVLMPSEVVLTAWVALEPHASGPDAMMTTGSRALVVMHKTPLDARQLLAKALTQQPVDMALVSSALLKPQLGPAPPLMLASLTMCLRLTRALVRASVSMQRMLARCRCHHSTQLTVAVYRARSQARRLLGEVGVDCGRGCGGTLPPTLVPAPLLTLVVLTPLLTVPRLSMVQRRATEVLVLLSMLARA